MDGEILYNMGQLYGVKDFSVDEALKNHGSRAALFASLLELSTLSDRLFSAFSPNDRSQDTTGAATILDGIRERLERLAAPALAVRTGGLLDSLAEVESAEARRIWSNFRIALETFNGQVAAARRRYEPVQRERFARFFEDMSGNADSQAILAHLRELRSSFYSAKIESILERIEQLLMSNQRAEARSESSRLLESIESGEALDDDYAGFGDARNASGRPKKILVVDDVSVILLMLKSLLTPRYQVIAVKDYQAAIKALGSTRVDLILTDINMPGMDGITLTKVIRAMDGYKKTPILFLTGNSDRESVLDAINAGGNDFIRKPINREVLMPKIEKFLSEE